MYQNKLEAVLDRMRSHLDNPVVREAFNDLRDYQTFKAQFHDKCGNRIFWTPNCIKCGSIDKDEIRKAKSEKVKLEADV